MTSSPPPPPSSRRRVTVAKLAALSTGATRLETKHGAPLLARISLRAEEEGVRVRGFENADADADAATRRFGRRRNSVPCATSDECVFFYESRVQTPNVYVSRRFGETMRSLPYSVARSLRVPRAEKLCAPLGGERRACRERAAYLREKKKTFVEASERLFTRASGNVAYFGQNCALPEIQLDEHVPSVFV